MKAILAMLLLAAAPPETKPDRTVSIAAERFFFSPSAPSGCGATWRDFRKGSICGEESRENLNAVYESG